VAEFRPDPHTEVRAALGEFGRALPYALLTAVVWVIANSSWSGQPDNLRRDRIVLIICSLVMVPALWYLAGGLVHIVRWRRARRWERMFDDPATAHLVPPLATHVRSVPSAPSRFVVVGGCVLLGAVSLGLTLYGTLALAGRVPAPHEGNDKNLSVSALLLGLFFALPTIGAVRGVREWRMARSIERLSSDASIAPAPKVAADVAVRRSSSIPRLNVVFGEAGRLRQASGGRAGGSSNDPLHILYLRLFDLDNTMGTSFFLNGPWRTYGYVYFLESATQFDADELESAKDSGSVASLFITTPDQLEAAIVRQASGRRDDVPRPEGSLERWKRLRWMIFGDETGRYPLVALPCHGQFWKSAVDLLLARMDLVALDLSGYRPQHAGTRYELQRVIDRYPIERVTLLAETTSDRAFLTAQVEAAWTQMADGSPNAGNGSRTVYVAVPGHR
jgi:hypothetical protein